MTDQTFDQDQEILMPTRLQAGDRVRFVSPASTPDREGVLRRARILESWGLQVEFGQHAFAAFGYLAGRDEDRLADLDQAFRDPGVRAIFATRGGKGSYRIADKLDFQAVRNDPKFLVGFSDITILHLNLWHRCRLVGVHGALVGEADNIGPETSESLRRALMTGAPIILHSQAGEDTSALTTEGQASGILLGGNLDMISTSAGWALPSLTDAILLIEAVNMALGQVDRALTMLVNAGHLHGLKAIAIGQFSGFGKHGDWSVVDVLRDHFNRLGIPILGGLPIGHGPLPRTVLHGTMAHLDASLGTLAVMTNVPADNAKSR